MMKNYYEGSDIINPRQKSVIARLILALFSDEEKSAKCANYRFSHSIERNLIPPFIWRLSNFECTVEKIRLLFSRYSFMQQFDFRRLDQTFYCIQMVKILNTDEKMQHFIFHLVGGGFRSFFFFLLFAWDTFFTLYNDWIRRNSGTCV